MTHVEQLALVAVTVGHGQETGNTTAQQESIISTGGPRVTMSSTYNVSGLQCNPIKLPKNPCFDI